MAPRCGCTANANDWTARPRAIADGARRIKAKSFTIDGEAVVLGPDGLSQFEELNRREAAFGVHSSACGLGLER
jgi:ATP-dependent DNA ligase